MTRQEVLKLAVNIAKYQGFEWDLLTPELHRKYLELAEISLGMKNG